MDTQEAFVQSLADDAVSIDGTDYLPVGKPNSYKDYELIYYINDVTIDNEEVLVEYGAAGTATGTYEYGLQRLSVEYVNEAKEYYLYNGTGNVTQTTAENGSMFLRYTYDPFGNVTSINAPMTVDIDDLNRYTYNGEDYDYNTGLQYLRARYYSTGTGNFISQDTYLGNLLNPLSQNRYTYAHNNPNVYIDPSGNSALLVLGIIALVGIVATVGGEAIENKAKSDYEEEVKDLSDNYDRYSEYTEQINTVKHSNADSYTKNKQIEAICDEAQDVCESIVENCSNIESSENWMTRGRYINGGGRIINGLMFGGFGVYLGIAGTAYSHGIATQPAITGGFTYTTVGYAEINAGLAQFGLFGDQREEVIKKADQTYDALLNSVQFDAGVGYGLALLDASAEVAGVGAGIETGGHVDFFHVRWDNEKGLRTGQEEVFTTTVEYIGEITEEENIFTPSLPNGGYDTNNVEVERTDTIVEVLGLDSLDTGASLYTPYGGAHVSLSMDVQEYFEEFSNIWF